MATEKIPIRAVFDGATATGLAEYQATEVVGVTYGGIGTNTLTSNSILLGNGTSAIQSSAIQIVGTSLSSTDSSTININEGLTVEGNLIVTGSITGTIANTSLTNSGFTLADDSSSTTTISLGETLKISGTSNEIETAVSGDTITIGLPSNVTIGNNLIVTGDLTVNGTTTTVNSTTIEITNSFTFEGTTANDFETVLGVIDPTADRAINLPNVSGTVITTGNISDITGLSNSQLSNPSFTLTDDSSTTTTISLGETLKVVGGSGVDTSISGDTLTIALESSIVTETSTDTLTNKSISLSTNTITGTLAEFNTALSDADFATLAGSETLTNKTLTTPIISSISNTGTLTLPTSTDTLVGRATTDTLTNKTFTSPKINEDVAVTATATELNYTDGVTSAIQTQLDAKASRAFAIAQAVALG